MIFSILFGTYVTCTFNGQLGNQLFEAAAAITYALDHGCEPVFPEAPRALNGVLNTKYVFHRLNTLPLPKEVSFLLIYDQVPNAGEYKEIPYQPDRDIQLVGHFLNERHFKHHEKLIRELFAPSPEILERIYQKYGDILAEPTVAVHVRTGIPDGRDPEKDGILGASWHYFVDAMDHFPAGSHFIVFADNLAWVKSRFPGKNRRITFIEGNPHYIDFYLMSLCDHQIVSPKSTFSWWAAWLNNNPNKIVIAEDQWNDLSPEINDVVPEGWIQISKKSHLISRKEMNRFSY